MPSEVRDVTYPFSNFNCCTVEIWEWIRNFNAHFMMGVITYPCFNKACYWWLIVNNSTSFEVTSWRWTGNKSLPQPMLTKMMMPNGVISAHWFNWKLLKRKNLWLFSAWLFLWLLLQLLMINLRNWSQCFFGCLNTVWPTVVTLYGDTDLGPNWFR